MRGTKAKQIRKLMKNPSAELLVLVHKVYGERTKNMDRRAIYQAVKKMYKRGYINLKRSEQWKYLKSQET